MDVIGLQLLSSPFFLTHHPQMLIFGCLFEHPKGYVGNTQLVQTIVKYLLPAALLFLHQFLDNLHFGVFEQAL